MSEIREVFVDHAKRHYGGHYTIMGFSTHYRAIFGTVGGYEDVAKAAIGMTEEEAMYVALRGEIDVYMEDHPAAKTRALLLDEDLRIVLRR